MLKRLFSLFIAVVALMALSGSADAVPVYYTFEGTTTSGDDGAGAIAAAGLTTSGSAVSYTFLVDRAVDGTALLYNGLTLTWADTSSAAGTEDFFHTDLVSAPLLQDQDGGYAPLLTGGAIEDFNRGRDLSPGHATELNGGSSSMRSSVTNSGTGDGFNFLEMVSWTVGDTGFYGSAQALNSAGATSHLYSSLTLTAISSTNPYASVPEPSTLLLLGSGLAGLGFVRRRLKV